MSQLPLIGLMLGDATGIGPEISVKILGSGAMDGVARLVVIGDVPGLLLFPHRLPFRLDRRGVVAVLAHEGGEVSGALRYPALGL